MKKSLQEQNSSVVSLNNSIDLLDDIVTPKELTVKVRSHSGIERFKMTPVSNYNVMIIIFMKLPIDTKLCFVYKTLCTV